MFWFSILADAPDNMASFSPYAALGANAALVGMCVWLITKHMPERDREDREARDKHAKEEREARDRSDALFAQQLREINLDFGKQLDSQRKQSSDLAHAGQSAVTALSEAFHELAFALSVGTTEKMTKSGILRHRERIQQDRESVLS